MKVHNTPLGTIVALCDAALIGKVLSDGKRRLDLSMHASFYQGKKVLREEAVAALKSAQSANLVGKKSVSAAKKAGFDVSCAKSIGEVLHLQAYKV